MLFRSVVLRVEGLNVGTKVRDVSFSLRAGEILGFSGLVGSGRTEAMRAIFGADKMDSGLVELNGVRVQFRDPRSAIQSGFGYLSEDRKSLGLLVHQSIRMNTTLTCLQKVTRGGFIRKHAERAYAAELLAQLATKYGSLEDDADSLSGGNQQKIALAKWIASDCRCLVFDEPTRGVDIGAKIEIYNIMNKLAAQGIAIIMISSEMTEIIGVCDRAIVMHQGHITGELPRKALTEENIMRLAMKEV